MYSGGTLASSGATAHDGVARHVGERWTRQRARELDARGRGGAQRQVVGAVVVAVAVTVHGEGGRVGGDLEHVCRCWWRKVKSAPQKAPSLYTCGQKRADISSDRESRFIRFPYLAISLSRVRFWRVAR